MEEWLACSAPYYSLEVNRKAHENWCITRSATVQVCPPFRMIMGDVPLLLVPVPHSPQFPSLSMRRPSLATPHACHRESGRSRLQQQVDLRWCNADSSLMDHLVYLHTRWVRCDDRWESSVWTSFQSCRYLVGFTKYSNHYNIKIIVIMNEKNIISKWKFLKKRLDHNKGIYNENYKMMWNM